MAIDIGVEVEVVLENNLEKDSLQGTFQGWKKEGNRDYLVIRMPEYNNLTYISERLIKAIHVYPRQAAKVVKEGPVG